jgi:peptidoglycan/LPS O-acetylase OafA/YrhL
MKSVVGSAFSSASFGFKAIGDIWMKSFSSLVGVPLSDKLRGLRRITTTGNYIPEIDGLRFVAILSVVLFHVPGQIPLHGPNVNWFWYLVSNGKRGVELFFTISGFILAFPFASHVLRASKAVSVRSYFLRRVTRLEPPYILAIFIRLPLLLLVMHKPLRFVLIHGFASLFYLHSLIFGTMSAVNPPAWSLEVEIQFYCLAPFFAWSYFELRPKWLRRGVGVGFLVLAGVLQRIFIPEVVDSRLSLSILNYVQYFFAGFLLCDLYLTDWETIPAHWTWDILSTILWCWIFLAYGWSVHLFLPFAVLLAYLGAFKGKLYRAFFRTPWVSLIGGMCYNIYLTHNLAITGVADVLHPWVSSAKGSSTSKAVLAYAVCLPAVFAIGLLLYVVVERPCMDKGWPSKLIRWLRHRGTSPAEVTDPPQFGQQPLQERLELLS